MVWRASFFNLFVPIIIAWLSLGILIMEEILPTSGYVQKSLCQSQSQFQMLVPKSGNCCTFSCSDFSLSIIKVTHPSDKKQAWPCHGTWNPQAFRMPWVLTQQYYLMSRAKGGEVTLHRWCQVDELLSLPWFPQSPLTSEVILPFATQTESFGTHFHTWWEN